MSFLHEDYIVFMDESGDDDLQVVTGLFVPVRWMRSAYQLLDDIRATEGFKVPEEMKASVLATGRGFAWQRAQTTARPAFVSKRDHALKTGCDIYTRVLGKVAGLNGLRVVSLGLQTPFPQEVYRLWFWALCAGLTSYTIKRPRVSMIVIDGQDQGLLRSHRGIVKDFYGRNKGRQWYLKPGRAWFIGGAVLHDSRALPFIQMADLVAHAAFQTILQNPKRAYMHGWYDQSFCRIAANRNRQIEASRFVLHELAGCKVPPDIAAYAGSVLVAA
ncbi:MAG: DUF3800 domain-containing protein [Mycobacteriales bacterium]